MSEKNNYSDSDYNADDSRRSFLKKLGITGLGAAATVAGVAGAKEYGEQKTENIIEQMINGPKKEISIESGDTLWGIYGQSGYTDIPADYYIDAIKKMNPELDEEQLQVGSTIAVPWKSTEGTE